jgi:hypothetical protein
MEVLWVVAADYASYSEGKPNILGAFSEIRAVTLPVTLPQVHIVASLLVSTEDVGAPHHIEYALLSPSGRAVSQMAVTVDVQDRPPEGEMGIANHIIVLHQVTFSEEGEHRLRVLIDGEKDRAIPIYVRQLSKGEKP